MRKVKVEKENMKRKYYKKYVPFMMLLLVVMTSCGQANDKESKSDKSQESKTNHVVSSYAQQEEEQGYRIDGNRVVVYGKTWNDEESNHSGYDFDDTGSEDNPAIIEKGILPSDIVADDNVDTMLIEKECHLVWREPESGGPVKYANNLQGCKGLENITVEKENLTICSDDGILYKNFGNEKQLYACPTKKRGDIIIPDYVHEVWASACNSCSEITSVKISKSVRGIGNAAFGNMIKCEKIIVDKKNPYYVSDDGILYTKDMRVLVAFPAGKSMEELRVPEGVEYIAAGAFMGVNRVKSIVLPKSLKEICNYGFCSCGVQNIAALGKIEKIGEYAFYKTPTPEMNIPRSKGKDKEYSTEWREIVDKESLNNRREWVYGHNF